ncbi:hypothetical protein DSO57_1005223 [Entomophthora muscae]|uniref:Uncharacterized protein n=1 Tax=Entomophthora muscae TaxID=34485 RepID=A0ACC2U5R1_9FUNG|nr:hypothetical protein DSO57_1005223 [Entomophthora muscae]
MPSLLKFERAKFGVLCVKTAAARKEVPTSTLEEAWTSLEVTKAVPAKSLVEVKAAFEELYFNYFAKEGTHVQGSPIYAWDAWNLLVGWDEILQQVKEMANCEIEALRAREEKSVEIMARWWDENKVLSKKIAYLEAKLLEALSQEGNNNKSQGQDNGRMDWLGLDPSHIYWKKYLIALITILINSSVEGPECPRQSASLPEDKTTNRVKSVANCLPRRQFPFLTANGQGFVRLMC